MPSLEMAGRRFETIFQTNAGLEFVATIQPLDDNTGTSFTHPRMILRVRHDSVVTTRDVMIDSYGRRFLLANHAAAVVSNQKLYRSHYLFEMTHQLSWSRRAGAETDTLTGLSKKTSHPQDLGLVWCMLEQFGREDFDITLRVKEQTRRIVTGADIQLGDLVDSMVVKRLDLVMGVWLAEIQ